ncbi:ubiquinone/menaquinone biosynthesis methyltransferase [Escherichia coli]|uniref:Ubiquinone/menaquinone biosynthesis methyltransferase n=1 Tax=Escherichia coli TaxID=562 RepID=A0A377CBM4_ECOLX|nr:ubiquinone/menaquinone biosynthesis methyltransferase [Escherichia coli]
MVDKSQETTHFGFQTVAKEQKADMVAHVFHSVASKYDVMNDFDVIWYSSFVEAIHD